MYEPHSDRLFAGYSCYAEKALRFVHGISFDEFRANEEKVLAVTRALEVIGEAARYIPLSIRERYPDVPWREMVAMRNKMIHAYFGIDIRVLWRTVTEDLPPLLHPIQRAIEELRNSEQQ